MWELDCKESWALKNWCFYTVVSRRLLKVSWTARRSNQFILKEISWDFFGRNDAKAKTPKLWTPHAKSWLIWKDSDAGRDWGQEEKGTTEGEMAGWRHWLDGYESEWTLGIGDGQGGLACCDSRGHKESDTTERLNWTEQTEGLQFGRHRVWSNQTSVLGKKRDQVLPKAKSHMVVQEFWLTQMQERKDLSLRDRLSCVVLGWKGPISIFSFWNIGQMFWKPALRQSLVKRSDSSRAEMCKSHFLNGLLAPFCLSILVQFCFWLHHGVPY